MAAAARDDESRAGPDEGTTLKRALSLLVLAGCASNGPRFELPEGEREPVIVLRENVNLPQFQGDLEPLVLVRDGTMISAAGEARIDAERMDEILAFVVDLQRFFDIDTEAVKLAIHQANSQRASAVAVLNASTTTIEVHLRDRSHVVTVNALKFQAFHHKQIAVLQQLVAIQHRVVREFQIAILGGDDALKRVLAAATEKLAEGRTVTLDHLVSLGRQKNDGTLVALFNPAWSRSYVVISIHPDGTMEARATAQEYAPTQPNGSP